MTDISVSFLQVLQVQEAYRGWAPQYQWVEEWAEVPDNKDEGKLNTFSIRFNKMIYIP